MILYIYQKPTRNTKGIKHLNLHSRHQQLGRITLSLGVAIFPLHGITGERVIQAADSALYKAKAEGRDRVVVAS
ncbi:diguanylate cyclase [Floridanema evergladense]|uniref:Diguanylate cyclase n=1 Tax=Floridaenema evergladense BLCC-F167 TaxID=3153639 RepID=A0ABV4WFF1_9CYAN